MCGRDNSIQTFTASVNVLRFRVICTVAYRILWPKCSAISTAVKCDIPQFKKISKIMGNVHSMISINSDVFKVTLFLMVQNHVHIVRRGINER